MKNVIKEIIFYGPGKSNPCIQVVTNWSTEDLQKLISYQEEIEGRIEHHFRSGYPVYCIKCGAPITLSPIENNTAVCDHCQKQADINRSKLAKAYK